MTRLGATRDAPTPFVRARCDGGRYECEDSPARQSYEPAALLIAIFVVLTSGDLASIVHVYVNHSTRFGHAVPDKKWKR